MMDMNPGDYGVTTNLQYSHTFHPWFGVEARLGLVRRNTFPASNNYEKGDPGFYSGWGITDEFDAYIRTIPASEAILTSWQTATFFAADASVFISPLHTARHRLKLYAGVTRQHRSVTRMLIAHIDYFREDDLIADYTPGYTVINISEWGKHYGIAYQYFLHDDWSVGATAKLTYIDFKVSQGYSNHALFGLSVGKVF